MLTTFSGSPDPTPTPPYVALYRHLYVLILEEYPLDQTTAARVKIRRQGKQIHLGLLVFVRHQERR